MNLVLWYLKGHLFHICQNVNEKVGSAEYTESFPVYRSFTGTDYQTVFFNETFLFILS